MSRSSAGILINSASCDAHQEIKGWSLCIWICVCCITQCPPFGTELMFRTGKKKQCFTWLVAGGWFHSPESVSGGFRPWFFFTQTLLVLGTVKPLPILTWLLALFCVSMIAGEREHSWKPFPDHDSQPWFYLYVGVPTNSIVCPAESCLHVSPPVSSYLASTASWNKVECDGGDVAWKGQWS